MRTKLSAAAPTVLAVAIATGAGVIAAGRGTSVLVGVAAIVAVMVAVPLVQEPRRLLAALLFLTAVGFNQTSVALGPIDMRVTDPLFALALIRALMLRKEPESGRLSQPVAFGLLAFVGGMFVSLFVVLAEDSGLLLSSAISWSRLLQLALLTWTTAVLVRTDRDRRLVVLSLLGGGAILITRAGATAVAEGRVDERIGANLGPNTFGLIAALVLILALRTPIPSARWVRLALVAIGLIGLVLAKSIASIAAVGVVIGLFGLRTVRRQGPSASLLRPMRVMLLLVAVVALVGVLRPENLPDSEQFESSSSVHRLVLGFGGLQLFFDHPLSGVGWQRSDDPAVIGDAAVADALRGRFTGAREIFFPDENPGSVHNLYIQTAAEGGLLGLAGLALLIRGIVVASRRHPHGQRPRGPDSDVALAAVAIVAIWWNDNPLYGAQPESIVFAVMLGLLAVRWRADELSGLRDRIEQRDGPVGGPVGSGNLPA